MKKYIPSPKNNLQLKDEIVKELNAFIYNLSKGKYNKELPKELVDESIDSLKIEVNSLENAVGTGKEDILASCEDVRKKLADLKKESANVFQARFGMATEELTIAISTFKDIILGNVDDIAVLSQKKTTSKIKQLEERIEELENVKCEFLNNERRLEGEIRLVEKDVEELEDKMLESDNERVLNDLYRKISSSKSKINTLNVRRTNYSACYSILDIIESNAKEIIVAGSFAQSEIGVAKALLNMERIKSTVSNPESAIPILRVMEKNIKDISEKVKEADKKIFGMAESETEINTDAMQYKEELLKKKRERETFKAKALELDSKLANDDESVKIVEIENKGE